MMIACSVHLGHIHQNLFVLDQVRGLASAQVTICMFKSEACM